MPIFSEVSFEGNVIIPCLYLLIMKRSDIFPPSCCTTRRRFPAVCTSFSWLISWRRRARVLHQSWRCSASPLCLMSNTPLSVRTAGSNRARGEDRLQGWWGFFICSDFCGHVAVLAGSRRGCSGCTRTFTVQSASGFSGEGPTPAGLCSGASVWTQRTSWVGPIKAALCQH